MVKKASIEWLDDRSFAIYTPYEPEFVKALKEGTRSREWNPEQKRWEFLAHDYSRALMLMYRHFDIVEVPDFQPGANPYDIMGVKPNAPMEVIEAAYRAMTKLHHPDLHGGGANARMVKINAAMDAIRRARR